MRNIITQIFHSCNEIDEEFIPSIEKFLSNSIPSLSYLKNWEKTIPDSTYLTYYIFFSKKNNEPIGLILSKSTLNNTNNLIKFNLRNFLKKRKNDIRDLLFESIGSSTTSIHTLPHFKKEILLWFYNFNNKKPEYNEVKAHLSKDESELPQFSNWRHLSDLNSQRCYSFIRTDSNYLSYKKSLSSSLLKDLQNDFYSFSKLGAEINQYDSLKKVFSYKSKQDLYQK
jgi:hypothetical protein